MTEDDPDRPPFLTRVRAHLMDFTPLRESRDFRLLFLGKSVSDLGDEIAATVVPFQVYQLTHSTLAVGLLGLCALVPVFVFPIIGGAFADAVERRRFVVVMHAILAAMSALMAVNAPRDHALRDGLGRSYRGVRALGHALAVTRDAHDRGSRRHGERHLPDDDPAN